MLVVLGQCCFDVCMGYSGLNQPKSPLNGGNMQCWSCRSTAEAFRSDMCSPVLQFSADGLLWERLECWFLVFLYLQCIRRQHRTGDDFRLVSVVLLLGQAIFLATTPPSQLSRDPAGHWPWMPLVLTQQCFLVFLREGDHYRSHEDGR